MGVQMGICGVHSPLHPLLVPRPSNLPRPDDDVAWAWRGRVGGDGRCRKISRPHVAGLRVVAFPAIGIRHGACGSRHVTDRGAVWIGETGAAAGTYHLLAIAGRRNLGVTLQRFDELARETPWLVNLSPSGKFLMAEFFAAGGVPALQGELRSLLHLDVMTVSGRTLGENIKGGRSLNKEVIRTTAEPLSPQGAIAVVSGNLAPQGGVIKISAASPHLMQHRGKAIVFKDYDDMLDRVNDPALPVTADSVLVLQNAGPKGVPSAS